MFVLERGMDEGDDALEVNILELQFTIQANRLAFEIYSYREGDTEHNRQTREKLFKNS